MKITSAEKKCWINIESRNDPGGYSGFEVEARVDIGHGLFTAKNIDVQFLNLDRFVSEFDSFILDRSLTPRLEGTYDTYMAFSAIGGAVMLEYSLGDAYSGRKTVHFYQSGEFEVEQENLLEIMAGLRELIREGPG